VAGLAGLQGLDKLVVQPPSEQGELERSGLPADRRHGGPLLTGPGYPTSTGPYPTGPQGAYTDPNFGEPAEDWCLGAAMPRDNAPPDSYQGGKGNHGGPFPAWASTYGEQRDGQATSDLQLQSMADHANDFGMGEQRQHIPADDNQGDPGAHYRQTRHLSAGQGSDFFGRVPGQFAVVGGGDRVTGFAEGPANANVSADVGHILRRDQSDGIPFNYQWLGAAHRPMIVRRAGVKNTYDGPDSPYGTGPAGDETQNMFQGSQGAVMTDPTPYVPPADPTYGGQPVQPSDAYAEW
jgi:hypothetical protein